MTAIETMRERAANQRAKGNDNLADLFEKQIEKGETHCRDYIKMMSIVGGAARRIRERGEID